MELYRAYSSDDSLAIGTIRQHPADFKVDEIPAFEPEGSGEHVFLLIEKTGENTDWVAGQLAKIAGVPRKDVSYAGLKDRHAITTQWFSIQLPGKDAPNWQQHLPETVKIIEQSRHQRKLRRGTLKGNRFSIIVRDLEGDLASIEAICQQIKVNGVPNYYGEQRFGHDNANINSATKWFNGEFKPKSRNKRSIYLSAARSWIFNQILSERVQNQMWNKKIPGDVFILDGSQSCFKDDGDENLNSRVESFDIHPSGALWGKGDLMSADAVNVLEQGIAQRNQQLTSGLIKHGLKQERRSLRLPVNDFSYEFDKDGLTLSFILSPGTYATSVLREIFKSNDRR